MTDDPTRMRNQPSLVTSAGRSWLVIGAIFTAIAVAVFLALVNMPPRGLAVGAIIADIALYAVMIAARLVIPPGRVRLRVMAATLISIAAVSLVAVLIVAGAAVPR